MSASYLNIILGVLIIFGAILYLASVFKRGNKIEKNDYMRYSNFIKIYGGIIGLMILGFYLIISGMSF
jgi:uncharacterized membrane protein